MQRPLGPFVFLVLLLLSALLLGRLFWSYVSAIVLALLLASVFYPLYLWVNKRLFRNLETLASLFMILFIFLVLVVPSVWFVGTLSNEAFDFYHRAGSSLSLKELQDAIASDSSWAQSVRKLGGLVGLEFTPEKVNDMASAVGKSVGLFLYRQVAALASNVLGFLVQFFLMMLTLFILFRDGARLKEYLIELLPVPGPQIEKVTGKFQEMARAIILGNGLSGVVQGILGGLGFYFFGLKAPVLWGTVIAFLGFLPLVGTALAYLPATAILLLRGNEGLAIAFLIYNVLYSTTIDYFVKPRIMGQGMQMNSLLVFFGIVGGLKLFGAMGLVYGPLIITVFLTLAEIYRQEYKEQLG